MDRSTGDEPNERDKRSSEEYEERPSLKRARVALACQRCRARKKKCDGAQDSCSTCRRLGLRCHYKAHLAPKPNQNKLYINALEDRIAELESFLSGLGYNSVGDDHWKQKQYEFQKAHQTPDVPQTGETDTLINAVRDLASNAGIHYMKGTPTVSLGRVLGSVISSQKAPCPELDPETVAIGLLEGWMKHFSTRYPVIHSLRLRELHTRRDEALDFYDESILHLIYANSGRFLETTGETGDFFSDQHYEAALQHMNAILQLHDTRSIIYLLLMALYCLRSPKDPGAWILVGLAMRLCIELARPPAISDSDMDVELPLDVDEDVEDLEILQRAAQHTADYPASPHSSLTNFIHFM
ncbi:hypothetical protein G7Y89_g5635 [Cudoniella acicularis]|uniref:Zn(2)-C6 fungal-type domain-containing protein n=1 Tax=Cudoniella acicularis TaxID=354080 RepID=A0A8H4W3T1_9HELO|nr:hypothetical protein G7Y89_g5635 [Cudoniella acicularis]